VSLQEPISSSPYPFTINQEIQPGTNRNRAGVGQKDHHPGSRIPTRNHITPHKPRSRAPRASGPGQDQGDQDSRTAPQHHSSTSPEQGRTTRTRTSRGPRPGQQDSTRAAGQHQGRTRTTAGHKPGINLPTSSPSRRDRAGSGKWSQPPPLKPAAGPGPGPGAGTRAAKIGRINTFTTIYRSDV